MRGNIRHNLPDAAAGEIIEELTAMKGDRIRFERILSEGQATPQGFWYDQAWDEWVMILAGGAELEFENPPAEETMLPGDWLLIPAHRRHRVRNTEKGTLWLAVHGGGEKSEE